MYLSLEDCASLGGQDGFGAAVRFFRECGGTFLRGSRGEPHPDPSAAANDKGETVGVLSLRHRALQPDWWTLYAIGEKGLDPGTTEAWGSCSYFAGAPSVGISQWVEFPDG